MKEYFFTSFLLSTILFGQQAYSQTYQFSKDILKKIESDSVAWKYQVGATELSFNGYYKETLDIWDKNGVRKANYTVEDSLRFVNSKKVNAKDFVVKQSANYSILIINEAHHIPKHRTFTKSLLKDLYANGYRYLGLEALFDEKINQRKFPVLESGYYTKEPEFGNLINEALKLGFTIFSYEASPDKNGKDREIEQAENIQRFIENNPKGKVIIHCGYAHAFENDYPAWGKAMAGRLKDNMKIDPLTIDQTMFLEKAKTSNNHLYIQLNDQQYPIVLLDRNEKAFSGFTKDNQTDIVVIHPQTTYENNRPVWFTKDKEKFTVPQSKINKHHELLILAYRKDEYENDGIPTDIIEVIDQKKNTDLYLEKGRYTIVLKDRNYEVIETFDIEV